MATMNESDRLPSSIIAAHPQSPSSTSVRRSRSSSFFGSRSSQGSFWPLLLLLIFAHLTNPLYFIPLNRVIERRLCREHYGEVRFPYGSSIPEKMCKDDEIQQKLAWLLGVMDTTYVVLDLLVTIPFSFAAEKFGIKAVLCCNLVPRIFMSLWAFIVGEQCPYDPCDLEMTAEALLTGEGRYEHVLPTKAILAGPLTALLGGECVFSSTIFTLSSALAKEHVQRGSYFSYVSSTTYVVSFIGPSLAAFTMSRSLYLPFFINVGLLLLAVPMVKLLPEAREQSTLVTASTTDDEADTEAGPLLGERSSSPSRFANAFEGSKAGINISQALKKLVRLVVGRQYFQILLLSFFLTALASSDTKLLVQYISVRFQWTFAQAGYMLSAKALVNFVLLTVIVPRMIKASASTKLVHGSEVKLNVWGSEVSIAVSVIGVLLVAVAFKFWILLVALVVYALGSALPVFTMSLVKSPLVALAGSDIQDFSIVIMVKTLGSLVGAPLMAFLWIEGIRIGGAGLGLPYFVSACIYLSAAFVIVRLRQH